MNNSQLSEVSLFLSAFRKGIWFLCIPAWMFGSLERSVTTLRDGMASAVDITQVFTAFFFLVCWLFLKPVSKA